MTTLAAFHDRARFWAYAWAARPLWADALVAAVIIAVTLVTTAFGVDASRLDALALVSAVMAGGVLVLRRRYPFATLVVSALAAEVYLAHHDGRHASLALAAPLVALATVAELATRLRAVLVGGVIVLSIGVTHVWLKPSLLGAENLALAALGGLAVAAGTASRHRHAYLAEARARADQAEADREAEARRRVTEERLRIARDLHDVIGHHLALIHVQARVAAHALGATAVPAVSAVPAAPTAPAGGTADDTGVSGVGFPGAGSSGAGLPDTGLSGAGLTDSGCGGADPAVRALEHVCAASKAALTDLGDTIGLLRQPDDPPAPTAPLCGLDSVDGLLATYRRSGLDIAFTVVGAVRPLSGPADLTAFRVIQESLTNVCKHAGPTRVTVELTYRADVLEVAVENPVAGRSGGRPGHGHVGMRERVGALGGTFTAGPTADGRYRVEARLPEVGTG